MLLNRKAVSNDQPTTIETIGTTRWVAYREHADLLRELRVCGGEPWKSGASSKLILAVRDKRACYAYTSPETGRTYFIKVYRYQKISTRLRHIFRLSQGEKEWHQGTEAARRGMRIPAYLALGTRREGLKVHEDYCISEFREGLMLPTDWLADSSLLEKHGGREAFLHTFSQAFGAEVRRLHDVALYHREMKPGNLYLEESEDGLLSIGFLDGKHITVLSQPSEKQRIINLLRTFRMWEPEMRKHALPRICQKWFLEGYLGEASKGMAGQVWRDLARMLRAAGDSIRGPRESSRR
ncbi:MAG: hypothetical protein FJ119_11550 [Deltaproteobacteria bacterium]|nr:hypothetical protein [Deltaproteobacteria bacterium]